MPTQTTNTPLQYTPHVLSDQPTTSAQDSLPLLCDADANDRNQCAENETQKRGQTTPERKHGHVVSTNPRFFVAPVSSSELITNTRDALSTFGNIDQRLHQFTTASSPRSSNDSTDDKTTIIRKHSLRHSCRLHHGCRSTGQISNLSIKRTNELVPNDKDSINSQNSERIPFRHRWKLPYQIWKAKFIEEHGCDDKTFFSSFMWSLIPHIFKIFIAISCITVGAFMFQEFDAKMVELPYEEMVLFAFTSVTTIGYGSIVPTSPASIVFCLVYICLGVPTVFLVLSSFSELVANFYWTLLAAAKGEKTIPTDDSKVMPVVAAMGLLHGHALIGSLLFTWLMPELDFIDAFYLSFISITTIGYGDISPLPKSLPESILIITYLAVGIIFLATFITSLTGVIRRIHYIGRNFAGAEYVEVYFGGSKFTIGELLEIVSAQFNVTPQQLRDVVYELDELINLNGSNESHNTNNLDQRETITGPCNEPLLLSPAADSDIPSMPLSINTLNTRKNNYASRFSDDERQKLIQAVGVMCHLSESGNRSFRSTQPLLRQVTTRSANGFMTPHRTDTIERTMPQLKRSISAYNSVR